MKRGWIAAVVPLCIALAGNAWAQSRDENWRRCASGSIDRDVAIGACTAIIQSGRETDENLARAFTNRATGYLDEGDEQRAIADLSQALQLDPRYVPAIKLRDDLYARSHRYDLAAADFGRAIQLNPRDADAYSGRGLAYYSEGQYASAIPDLDQALRLNPDDAMSLYIRGPSRQETGDAARGKADIARALQLNPKLSQLGQ